VGYAHITPLLTYYGAPMPISVFVNERLPAYALVHRRLAPEYGHVVELELGTDLGGAGQLITLNTPASRVTAPGLRVQAYPGLSVSELVEQHKARVALEPAAVMATHASLDHVLRRVETDANSLRSLYRARKWIAPTADPALDRFTVRGAFALTHYSRRVFAARPPSVPASAPATVAPPVPWEEQRTLRVEADFHDALQVAEHPQAPPGTPWALLTMVAVTALVSFAAMTWLWNTYVAALLLAAITLHEAGHALAMRSLGYRDVHVFFIPLLGALTVGRPVAASVRNRIAVLLAGPLPGLWLAIVVLALDEIYGPLRLLRLSALTLLLLNGLNLLPFTPLDGGRALEALGRPESTWRLVVHGASAAGLLGLAAFTKDPLIAVFGLFWAALLPRQLQSHRLRRAVAAAVPNRDDFRAVVRTALEVMTTPPYARLRASTRQATARAIGRMFADSIATSRDRAWGAIAYASAWIPLIAGAWLWFRPD
jgi:Zn-dependent protease